MKVFIGVLIGIVFMIVVDAVNVYNEQMKEREPKILGIGDEGCVYYLRDQRQDMEDRRYYNEWALGYISALNFELKKRKVIQVPVLELDEFCKGTTMELSEALHTLYEEAINPWQGEYNPLP